jgi:hypothetical protein
MSFKEIREILASGGLSLLATPTPANGNWHGRSAREGESGRPRSEESKRPAARTR